MTLFSLDGKDVGADYVKLVNASRFFEGAVNSAAYWCDTTGGGRFTPLVASYAVSFIKDCIDDPSKIGAGASWEELSPVFVDFKKKYGYSKKHWKMTGKLQESIGVIYRGRHTRTIGIKRSISTKRIGFGGKKQGSIKVATYASFGEYGTGKQPARPLFGPAIREFTRRHFPKMVNAVDIAISKGIAEYSKYLNKGSGNIDTAANANISKDFPSVDPLSGKMSVASSAANKAQESYMKQFLRSQGVDKIEE